MNRFGGLGSSPAPPRPLSNGPVRAVPRTGERRGPKHFSSSGGSCRLSPGGRARLSVSESRAYFLVPCVSRAPPGPFQRHDQDAAEHPPRLGTETERVVRAESAPPWTGLSVSGAGTPSADGRHALSARSRDRRPFSQSRQPQDRPTPRIYKTPQGRGNLRTAKGDSRGERRARAGVELVRSVLTNRGGAVLEDLVVVDSGAQLAAESLTPPSGACTFNRLSGEDGRRARCRPQPHRRRRSPSPGACSHIRRRSGPAARRRRQGARPPCGCAG